MNRTFTKLVFISTFIASLGSMAAEEGTFSSGLADENDALAAISNDIADNIFGKDDRKPITTHDYPWSPIGYLSTGCTGTLVSKDMVVTAAHCVLDGKGATAKPVWGITFSPNRINGVAADTSGINWMWYGTNDPDKFRENDWALIRLVNPLGSKYGWMGTKDRSDIDRVTIAGYSADYMSGKTATANIGCYVKKRDGNIWNHDCDTTRGSSGGPMFTMLNNAPEILGINVAERRNGGETSLTLSEYSEKNANISIPTKMFLAKLKEMVK